MDKFSFLNSAHTSFFAEMYDQYLESPDSLEPSWKAFFQGFDFGLENANITVEEKRFEVPENIKKEFQVVNISDLELLTVGTIDSNVLKDNGLVKYSMRPIKVLGNGELTKKLNVTANSFSASAKEKIEKAGGSVTEQ